MIEIYTDTPPYTKTTSWLLLNTSAKEATAEDLCSHANAEICSVNSEMRSYYTKTISWLLNISVKHTTAEDLTVEQRSTTSGL